MNLGRALSAEICHRLQTTPPVPDMIAADRIGLGATSDDCLPQIAVAASPVFGDPVRSIAMSQHAAFIVEITVRATTPTKAEGLAAGVYFALRDRTHTDHARGDGLSYKATVIKTECEAETGGAACVRCALRVEVAVH